MPLVAASVWRGHVRHPKAVQDDETAPWITAVVCTRNRGDAVVRTVETILASDYEHFKLILVDQSDDDRTRLALAPHAERPEMEYLQSSSRGLSAARNEGIARSDTELIAMTDDDCEVTSGWLRGMVGAFRIDDRIGVVFGNALAGDHDRAAGFIPAFRCTELLMVWGVENKHRIEGIGACMGIRRSLWEALGGFDRQLGAGAPFVSAEDLDFAVRCLQAGCPLFATPDSAVIHHGLRTWADGPTLVTGYLFGIGAMFAKHLKLGRWSVVTLLWRLASRWAFAGPVVDLGHKPPRWLRLKAFVKGFVLGLRTPVDRSTAHYAPAHGLRAADGVPTP